jgi:hypothetical protein
MMEACCCALCGSGARGANLVDFIQSIDCPSCGVYEVTAGARVAWNALDAAKKEAALPKLRAAMHGREVVLGRADILRAAGLRWRGRGALPDLRLPEQRATLPARRLRDP